MILLTPVWRGSRLYSIDVLVLDVFDTLSSFLKVFVSKFSFIIWEVLLLDAFADDLLVSVVHTEIWHVRVEIWPPIPFKRHLFLLFHLDLLTHLSDYN